MTSCRFTGSSPVAPTKMIMNNREYIAGKKLSKSQLAKKKVVISRMLDTPSGRKRLGEAMIPALKQHFELSALCGLDAFEKYYVVSRRGNLTKWKPYIHGYIFHRKFSYKSANGETKNVLLRLKDKICLGRNQYV